MCGGTPSSRLSWGMIQNIHFNLTLSLVCFWRKTVRAITIHMNCILNLCVCFHSLTRWITILVLQIFLPNILNGKNQYFPPAHAAPATEVLVHTSNFGDDSECECLLTSLLIHTLLAIQQNPGYKRASRVIIVKFSIHIFKCIHSESTEIVYGHQCWWTGSDGSIITRPFSLAIFASR